MTQVAARSRAVVVAVVAGLVTFVALPGVLVVASRARFDSANPLAGVDPPSEWSLGGIRSALAEPLGDGTVIDVVVRTSLCLAWLAAGVIFLSTLGEIAHMIRHRGMARPSVHGLGWVQSVARVIAIGVVAILPTADRVSAAPPGLMTLSSESGAALLLDDGRPGGGEGDGKGEGAVESGAAPPTLWNDAQVVTSDVAVPWVQAQSVRSARGERTHEVQRGESVWSIASRLAGGDSERTLEIADAVLDANLGRTMDDGRRFTSPALVRPGWQLVIPSSVGAVGAGLGSPDLRPLGDASTDTESATDREADRGQVVHVVAEGDTLSGIAEVRLADAAEWPLIFEANDGVTMADGRTFDDPNLIVPGWELVIPSLDAAPSDGADATPDPDVGGPVVADDIADPHVVDDHAIDSADADDDAIDAADAVPDAEDAVESSGSEFEPVDGEVAEPQDGADVVDSPVVAPPSSAPSPTPTSTTSPTPSTAPSVTDAGTAAPAPGTPVDGPGRTSVPTGDNPSTTTTSVPVSPDSAGGDASDGRQLESPAAPSPIRVEQAAMLAAGVLALVGLRRLQRLRRATPRSRIPSAPADVVEIERALRAIEPGEGVARIDVALRAVGRQLAGSGSQVGFVCIADDGAITLRLTAPFDLDAPWTGRQQDWELPAHVPIELLAVDARVAGQPCQALVEVGRDEEGHTVLLDLEAAGLTAVEARPGQADEIVRAVAAGLATSPHAEVANLVTVSLGTEALLEHPNAHVTAAVFDAVDLALSADHVSVDEPVPTFDRRVWRTGGEMWEPSVLLLPSVDRAAERFDPSRVPGAGSGVAVIAAVSPDQLATSGARIVAHADRWELIGFGTRLVIAPIGLSDDDLERVTALVADAETSPIPDDGGAKAALADDQPVDLPFEPRPHEIVVALMGGLEIRSRGGDAGSFERSKTVELIAWLATHRDRATRAAARTALWEIDVRDATFANVVSEARRALGRLVTPPEDEEWIARTLTESLPLHDLVVTDADLIRERLDHAQLAAPSHAIDVLEPAVEMIREMPFAGTSYLWPDADGIMSDLVLLATTVTAELAAHALSIADIERVFWATGHGLRVLPGHEELIALRMRAHARAGDLAGVRSEWESYERVIVADAWSDGEPAPKLLELRHQLLSPPT